MSSNLQQRQLIPKGLSNRLVIVIGIIVILLVLTQSYHCYNDPDLDCLQCDQLTGFCSQCEPEGFYLLNSDKSCQPCVGKYLTGCIACDPFNCTSCQTGMALEGSLPDNCQPCSSTLTNCVECSSRFNCTLCTGRFIPMPFDGLGNYTCQADCTQTQGCQTCDSDTADCTACLDNTFYITNNAPPLCTKCGSHMHNCTTCSSQAVCTSCDPGYYLISSSSCQSCSNVINNCADCLGGSSPVCNNCQPLAYFDLSQPDQRCVLCSSLLGCVTCDHGPICTECQDDLFIDTANNSQSCIACTAITHCLSCDHGPKCIQCEDGYLPDTFNYNKTCIKCNFFKCTKCTDGPICSQCQKGYFLDLAYNLCMPCSYPCIECDLAADNCTVCNSTSNLVFFNETGFKCSWCYHSIPECLSCNYYGTTCNQCNSSFYFVNGSGKCEPCSGTCYECTNTTQCISCQDTNHAIDPITKNCLLCSNFIPFCTTCITSKVCLTCDAQTEQYYLTYPPSSCVTCQQAHPNCVSCSPVPNYGPGCDQCQPKFFRSAHSCFDCPFSCATCMAINDCQTCFNISYALDSTSMCKLCSELITNCLTCSDRNTCTNCTNSTVIHNNGACMTCTDIEYPEEIDQLCKPCMIPCKQCLNHDDCLTCRPFYGYIERTKRCLDICGDSIVMTDECDNGLGVKNDGCSDKCKQEANYVCVKTPGDVSGQTVSLSTCSYNQTLNITLFQIQKESFKNIVTFTYSVKPYLFGLPGTTARQFSQEQLKKIFILYENSTGRLLVPSPTPGITVESVTVDSTSSQVSLTFSHDRDIKQSHMELYVDFGYLKTTLALPNFATTPDSNHLFQVASYQPQSMIGQFYSQEQYAQAELLHSLSTAIGIMSSSAFLMGIFTKEVVGLEMAMLCQFAYLSLFFFQGTLELPFFALKGLQYSTGYTLALGDTNFQMMDQNPPQSFALGFDPRTFSNNFNLMIGIYILPLVIVIPFIFLKAKCIRKISIIEMGHKWVDLLLGQIMFYGVMFNLQYLLMGTIVFYWDGRNTASYPSSMIIWFAILCTLCSFLGLIFKPQIYGNFRMVFKYDNELRREFIQDKKKIALSSKVAEKIAIEEEAMTFNLLVLKIKLFINENYFWKNYRTVHTVITYNHYVILFVFFTISIICLTLVKQSEIIIICLSVLILVQQMLFRPYSEVSQKIRGIFFFLSYLVITLVRYINNYVTNGEYNVILAVLVLTLLAIAIVWTYAKLISHFVVLVSENMAAEKIVVDRIFKNDAADQLDKQAVAEEEQALMRKLMKRYERVELQYNLNNIRNQLIQDDDSLDQIKPKFQSKIQSLKLQFQTGYKQKFSKQAELKKDILKKAQESNNFKNLRQEIEKEKKRKKKEEMKNKVTGTKMLQLLKLDNFTKYQKQFLMPQKPKNRKEDESNNKKKLNQSVQDEQKNGLSAEQIESQSRSIKDEYVSVQPANMEQVQKKLEQQKVFMDQNQYIRYKRAMQIISSQGLELDRELIDQNYHKI